MLTWTTQTGKPPMFQALLESEADGDIAAALAEFWRKLLDEIDGRQGDQPWDVIVCQIWPDTGRVIAHPATHRDYEWSNSKVMVELTVSAWCKEYERLPDPEANQAKFERAYGKGFKAIVSSLKKAAEDGDLKERFAKLKKNPLFGVFVVNAPESIHREKLQFLLGNRLPKMSFQTDIELFEALFRKASTYLEYCSVIEEEKIVRLTFFGRCFNDKVLSLLDYPADLAGMCAELQEIRIHATAISAKRIERLREQLPAVNIRVLAEKQYWDEKTKELGIKD